MASPLVRSELLSGRLSINFSDFNQLAVLDPEFCCFGPGPEHFSLLNAKKQSASGTNLHDLRSTGELAGYRQPLRTDYDVLNFPNSCYSESNYWRGTELPAYDRNMNISIDEAKKVIAAACRHATEINKPITVAVVDSCGNVIAPGKIAPYRIAGKPLSEGIALTGGGEPATDPALAEIPTPLGGAKGTGMPLMFELLTGVFIKKPTDKPIFTSFHSGTPEGERHRQNGALIADPWSAQ
jgi:Malate/L-lactate dehydrogenase